MVPFPARMDEEVALSCVAIIVRMVFFARGKRWEREGDRTFMDTITPTTTKKRIANRCMRACAAVI
eukprot:CAMPEP_0173404440 /NCGR_PEP_ID=MMETSP1356-20130122/59348_1 /TAXON_ID=77927 ORGANISM="Hemiselmis virescens, Strain PCC157" /NCGR_SAMPLE_ID=MMETSP1356 /ASSEMBLY_ACC=CAM_ASM_000847 /LENGTH=65 /DNA_ID=CAMNT_0014365115 /DNA_START=123 /DNA_END=317 /DNA_ORIENTATION=+